MANSAIIELIYEKIIKNRDADPQLSYSAELFQHRKGKNKVLEKIGEEASELIIAAKDENKQQIIAEMGDLWFHSLALLAIYGLSPDDIYQELKRRQQEHS